MRFPPENYTDQIGRLYPDVGKLCRSVTFQVTDGCNLCCKYCYQINKHQHMMEFSTAKKLIDLILKGDSPYFNFDNMSGFIIDLIGGEPLLNIPLMEQIIDYTFTEMIKTNHPWLLKTRASICSNGVLYFTNEFQDFLEKYQRFISFSISLDGNKELHDACRVFPDGSGSYDLAAAAAKDYMTRFDPYMSTKMTLSPENVTYFYDAITNLIDLGFIYIFCNCVFEDGWTKKHATILYYQMKKIADMLISTNHCEDLYIRMFDREEYKEFSYITRSDQNNCGGAGGMLAMDYKGDLYPCLRYMESSLGSDAPAVIIGNINTGFFTNWNERLFDKCLKCTTFQSQTYDDCSECPIGFNCMSCTALDYQMYKLPIKRTISTCIMHKAEALGNMYFWNKYYRHLGTADRFKPNMPDEWALQIIDREEWDMLKDLARDD